jgi:hypothetical protein
MGLAVSVQIHGSYSGAQEYLEIKSIVWDLMMSRLWLLRCDTYVVWCMFIERWRLSPVVFCNVTRQHSPEDINLNNSPFPCRVPLSPVGLYRVPKGTRPTTRSFWRFCSKCSTSIRRGSLVFCWLPGHTGLPGNEATDAPALLLEFNIRPRAQQLCSRLSSWRRGKTNGPSHWGTNDWWNIPCTYDSYNSPTRAEEVLSRGFRFLTLTRRHV